MSFDEEDEYKESEEEEMKEGEKLNKKKKSRSRRSSYRAIVKERCDTFVGTPNYLSPEVLARDIEHTLAIDIWSLGLIYFKMLTGRVAFPGGSEELIFKSIKER